MSTDAHSKRLHVLGLFNRQHDLTAYTFAGRRDREGVIACSDDFGQELRQRTVMVLEQAAIHTSKEFAAKIPAWHARHREIFYLPAYAPALNMIEILWRFMQ